MSSHSIPPELRSISGTISARGGASGSSRVASPPAAYTIATSPLVTSSTPGTSNRVPPARRDSVRTAFPPIAAASAIGMLAYRHQRQSRYSVKAPPASSPRAPPAAAMPPQIPNALARSFGSVNVTVSSDSAAGPSSAPNPPWRARATSSVSKPFAAPPSADAAVKPSSATRKVRLRPV